MTPLGHQKAWHAVLLTGSLGPAVAGEHMCNANVSHLKTSHVAVTGRKLWLALLPPPRSKSKLCTLHTRGALSAAPLCHSVQASTDTSCRLWGPCSAQTPCCHRAPPPVHRAVEESPAACQHRQSEIHRSAAKSSTGGESESATLTGGTGRRLKPHCSRTCCTALGAAS